MLDLTLKKCFDSFPGQAVSHGGRRLGDLLHGGRKPSPDGRLPAAVPLHLEDPEGPTLGHAGWTRHGLRHEDPSPLRVRKTPP